ncbi:MAG TPA: SAM-dependent chlorinase/fluorinase [Candidatus Omnitrophota bacterium]|nr:SAM-dependent chlorinase/fluorinase [Candidatus Omnitrophota bacterium]
MSVITLTTDFGTKDPYVASMKGVILGVNSGVSIVDGSHDIPPGDVREAAFVLETFYSYFPKGTVHVIVVDPGVGGERKLLCLKTRKAFFLAPDNGVLTAVMRKEDRYELREVSNARFFLNPVSATFHGRDKLAPAAAYLSRSNVFAQLGPVLKNAARIPWPEARADRNQILGEIIHLDRFGNLITNISGKDVRNRPKAEMWLAGRKISRWGTHYAQGEKGVLMSLIGSGGRVEIGLPNGSAAAKTHVRVGEKVVLKWR